MNPIWATLLAWSLLFASGGSLALSHQDPADETLAVRVVSGSQTSLFSISNKRARRSYWNTLNDAHTNPPHWFIATIGVENGEYTEPKVLNSFGVSRNKILKALDAAAKNTKDCALSNDGDGNLGNRLIVTPGMYGISTLGFMADKTGFLTSPQKSGFLISDTNVFDANLLNEALSQCEDRCTGLTLLGAMYGLANYYDSQNQPVSAGYWRFEALVATSLGAEIKRGYRRELKRQIQLLVNHAVTTYRPGLALATLDLARELLNDGETIDKIRTRISSMPEELGIAAKPLVITIPLVSSSPYSADKSAAALSLYKNDIEIEVISGEVSEAYLSCRSKGQGINAVQLFPKLKSRWQVPESYGTCRLFVFGDAGTKIVFTQYPG